MVNGLYLYSAFLVFWPLKALLHYESHSPIHTHSYAEWVQGLPCKVPTCPSEETNHSHTFIHWWHSHQEQFGVKYLAQGHIGMWTGGAGNRTVDLPISGWPALPPEPQPPHHLDIVDVSSIAAYMTSSGVQSASGLYTLLTYCEVLLVLSQTKISWQLTQNKSNNILDQCFNQSTLHWCDTFFINE